MASLNAGLLGCWKLSLISMLGSPNESLVQPLLKTSGQKKSSPWTPMRFLRVVIASTITHQLSLISSKGFISLPLEKPCFAIPFRLSHSSGLGLSLTHCAATHSCYRGMGGLTTMVNFAAFLFAHLAAFFHPLTSFAMHWRGLLLVLWKASHTRLGAISRLPTQTPAFSLSGLFNAFTLKDVAKCPRVFSCKGRRRGVETLVNVKFGNATTNSSEFFSHMKRHNYIS